MAIEKNNKIFSNLITKIFDEKIVRGMIISLSRKGAIEAKRETIEINQKDKKTNMAKKKLNICIMLNINDSIAYIENALESKTESERGMAFYEARKNWLEILYFTKKHITKLNMFHEEPNSRENILNELLQEKDNI